MIHKILATQKCGTDYGWFSVVTTRNETLIVYNVHWQIDDELETPELTERQKDDSGQVTECMISGKKKHIENLMYSIGYSLPNKPNDSVYINTVIELERQLRYLLDEIKDLKNAKKAIAETF